MTFFEMTQGAAINIFVLLGFVALLSMIRSWPVARLHFAPPWVNGFLFGVMAVVSMLVSSTTGPGVIFDCRSGVIGAGALLGGPLCALISIPLPCLYRLHIGGPGLGPGIMEIILPAVLGSVCHRVCRVRQRDLGFRNAIFYSLIIGVGSNGLILSFILIFMQRQELLLGIGSLLMVVLNGPASMALFSVLLVLEKQNAEDKAALSRSEGKYRQLVETTDTGYVITDEHGCVKDANQEYVRLTGRPRLEDVIGHNVLEWTASHDHERNALELKRCAKQGNVRGLEIDYITPDGLIIPIEINATMLKGEGVFQILSLCRDIAERKRAEEALRESQQRLNLASQSAQLGIWDWDIINNRMIWDDGMFQLYGIAEKPETYGVEIWEQGLHPEDKAQVLEVHQSALRGEKDSNIEFRVKHPDGTIRYLKTNGLVLRDFEGKPIRMLGVNYDITERKKAEDAQAKLQAQLIQSQKLESVGRLAGGVAHDFNNILAAIMMNIGLAETYPNLDPPIKQTLREIQSDAGRAAKLIRQLLLFSRRSVMNMELLDVSDLVVGFLKMLERLIGENISLRFVPKEGLTAVRADIGMLEQVLMNLVVNARDAMPNGGSITISVDKITADRDRIGANPEIQPGCFICLSVSDSGCGMDDNTRAYIFEPFFTTKEIGKGTGLGLSTVYGIVAQHHGWVEVESEVGKGATFKVYLPADPTPVSPRVQNEKDKALRGNETVLLVEDDQSLRSIMAQGLRSLGYGVIEAGNGQEAMQKWQQHHSRIDLLFSDMVMPEGLTGLDLAEKFRRSKIDLKVVISSGYSAEMIDESRLAVENITFLQKPYRIEAMAKSIRDSLISK
jgi:two-component system, cell cycle sensor histidine kinase and response regulator CckA